jgi:hypothetical protein
MRKLLSCLMLLAISTGAFAQEVTVEGELSVNLLSIEGLVVGQTVSVDADFGAEHGLNVPAPFDILIPTADDVRELILYAPNGPGGPFLKLNFVTMDDRLIENFQIIPMTLGAGTEDERLITVVDLLKERGWPMVVQNYPDNVQDAVRATVVAGYNAIEMVGRYADPELGVIYVRLVGIPHPDPNNTNGVLAVANIVAGVLELSGPEDLARTRGGVALEHFEFAD